MRFLPLLALVLLLAGCRGTQPYSQEDLKQVHQVYGELVPTFKTFEKDYLAGNERGILAGYNRTEQECKTVDQIDKRDTIDPNIKLFYVTIGFDDMCNAVESAYATWAPSHGYKAPKGVQTARTSEVFTGADLDLEKMPGYLKHPSDLA